LSILIENAKINNMWGDICGHKRQLEFLENAISRGKLAHGYLFAGPEGVGKRTAARRFAERLLELGVGSRDDKSNRFHPDLIELDGTGGIKIGQVRELIYKLSLKPYSATYKVAIIDQAENMTVEAQNALLKSLEEPTSYTVIVLVTANPQRLLKTISSRLQKITFGGAEFKDYENLLPAKLSSEQKRLIAAYAPTQPGIAMRISSDEDFLAHLSEIDSQYNDLISTDEMQRLLLVSALEDEENDTVHSKIHFWTVKLAEELKTKPSVSTAAKLRNLLATTLLLDQNLNSKLVLTNLMLNNELNA